MQLSPHFGSIQSFLIRPLAESEARKLAAAHPNESIGLFKAPMNQQLAVAVDQAARDLNIVRSTGNYGMGDTWFVVVNDRSGDHYEQFSCHESFEDITLLARNGRRQK